jgi:hypothetical protein
MIPQHQHYIACSTAARKSTHTKSNAQKVEVELLYTKIYGDKSLVALNPKAFSTVFN